MKTETSQLSIEEDLIWGKKVKASQIGSPEKIDRLFSRFPDIAGQITLPFDGRQDTEFYLSRSTVQQGLVRHFNRPSPEDVQKELKRWEEFTATPVAEPSKK